MISLQERLRHLRLDHVTVLHPAAVDLADDCRMVYFPAAVAWTQVPPTKKVLRRHPIVEFLGWFIVPIAVLTGTTSLGTVATFFLMTVLAGVVTSLVALLLDER